MKQNISKKLAFLAAYATVAQPGGLGFTVGNLMGWAISGKQTPATAAIGAVGVFLLLSGTFIARTVFHRWWGAGVRLVK